MTMHLLGLNNHIVDYQRQDKKMFHKSDLQADPDVHSGTLANGMRFAIMRNVTPAGQAAIRLHIASGSLQENGNQQGLAHFLEHMAFKGSTHVADGEIGMKVAAVR
nr:insulinase family protein [Rhizobium ruizarguesonis]